MQHSGKRRFSPRTIIEDFLRSAEIGEELLMTVKARDGDFDEVAVLLERDELGINDAGVGAWTTRLDHALNLPGGVQTESYSIPEFAGIAAAQIGRGSFVEFAWLTS